MTGGRRAGNRKGIATYIRRAARLAPYGFVSALYLLLSLEVRTRTVGPDWPIFMRALDLTLHGDALKIYSLREFGFHTFAYGPLSLFLMAPARLASEWAALSPELDRWVTWLPVYMFDILAGLLLCRVARRSPLASPGALAFLFTFYIGSWLLFFASPVHSHFESIVLSFLLMGLLASERGRFLLSGVLFALALLTKQSGVIVFIPHLLILARSEGLRGAGRFLAGAAVTGLAVMLPYLIADPANVLYMAVTLPGLLPVAYQSTLIAWKAFPAIYSWLSQYANLLILALALAVSGLAVGLRQVRVGGPRAYALYGLCGLIMLDFEKWGYLHFFLLPLAFLALWEFLAGRWPWGALTLGGFSATMYVLNADVATRMSFSYLVAPLVLLLGGLTVYAGAFVFSRET